MQLSKCLVLTSPSSKSLIDLESNTPRQQEIFGWTSYHTYSEIYAWLDSLLEQYPAILTNYLIGTSFEGRQIRAIRLSRRTVCISLITIYLQ